MPSQVKRVVADMPTGFGPMVVFLYNRVGYNKHPEQVFVSPGVWILRKGRESRFETWGNDAFEENFEYAGRVPNSVIEENTKAYEDELGKPLRSDLVEAHNEGQLAARRDFACSRCNHPSSDHDDVFDSRPCLVHGCVCARFRLIRRKSDEQKS